MRQFLKTLIGFFTIISVFALMILTTVTFLLLNPNFFIKSFRQENVYKNIEKGLKIYARNSLKNEINKQNISYEDLNIGQRQQIDSQVEKIVSPISVNNIQDLFENNIFRVGDYLNGKEKNLVIYLPVNKWGLNQDVVNQLPDYLKNENINIQNLTKDHPELKIDSVRLNQFSGLGNRLRTFWLISLISSILLTVFHLVLGNREHRFIQTGRLISLCGFITLLCAWIIKVAANTFGQNIAVRTGGADILMGTIASTLLNSIFIVWIVFAVIQIVIGLIMFNIKTSSSHVNKPVKTPPEGDF